LSCSVVHVNSLNAIDDGMQFKSLIGECIDYSEYKVWQGIPYNTLIRIGQNTVSIGIYVPLISRAFISAESGCIFNIITFLENTIRHKSPDISNGFARFNFAGTPNQLSSQPVNWQIIYQTADLARKPTTGDRHYDYADPAPVQDTAAHQISAAEIIRRRRSATDFDRSGSVDTPQFFAILDKTLPRRGWAPFDAELGEACAHLLIFVHRVAGLPPGLYFFCRNAKDLDPLQQLSRSDFRWRPVENNFPLYLLQEGDRRQQATMVSCHQDIAGSGVFSLGMIARFQAPITDQPFRYRHLFWETGMIGQVLYLAAEAHGLRGTGIGCFFDDAVHEILGIGDNQYQSLYHFTIGRPIEDPRLTTYPAYHHLSR